MDAFYYSNISNIFSFSIMIIPCRSVVIPSVQIDFLKQFGPQDLPIEGALHWLHIKCAHFSNTFFDAMVDPARPDVGERRITDNEI